MLPNEIVHNQPAKGIRLIFEYEGDAIRLISQQPVEMVIPAVGAASADHQAHFIDLRDAANKTLARVAARDAFTSSAEVFPEQSGDPITRVDIPVPKGAFTVVVPANGSADHFTVVKTAPDAEAVAGSEGLLHAPMVTTDIASFPLSEKAQPTDNGGAL